jgi:hypothetical protein
LALSFLRKMFRENRNGPLWKESVDFSHSKLGLLAGI